MPVKFAAVLAITLACVVLFGCGGGSSSSSSSLATGTLFVATQSNTAVAHFAVNLSNGDLSAKTPSVTTGSAPAAIAITPSGNLAFVANSQCVNGNTNCNSISRYTVDATGKFTELTGPQGVGVSPVALTLNPSGNLLFVANRDSNTVSVFTIQSDASLVAVAGSPFIAGTGPVALAVAPQGNFLYVANSISGDISAYSISSKGVLTPVLGPFVGTGATIPAGIVVAPNGTFVYVSNFGSNNVSAFLACTAMSASCPVADGSLHELSNSPFLADTQPGPLAITPSGNFLYVVDTGSDEVSGFTVNSTSGVLTATVPATITTGSGPAAITIQPTGLWLYTADYNAGMVSGFGIDPSSGLLTLEGGFITNGQPAALAAR